jgi:hypothetical protein
MKGMSADAVRAYGAALSAVGNALSAFGAESQPHHESSGDVKNIASVARLAKLASSCADRCVVLADTGLSTATQANEAHGNDEAPPPTAGGATTAKADLLSPSLSSSSSTTTTTTTTPSASDPLLRFHDERLAAIHGLDAAAAAANRAVIRRAVLARTTTAASPADSESDAGTDPSPREQELEATLRLLRRCAERRGVATVIRERMEASLEAKRRDAEVAARRRSARTKISRCPPKKMSKAEQARERAALAMLAPSSITEQLVASSFANPRSSLAEACAGVTAQFCALHSAGAGAKGGSSDAQQIVADTHGCARALRDFAVALFPAGHTDAQVSEIAVACELASWTALEAAGVLRVARDAMSRPVVAVNDKEADPRPRPNEEEADARPASDNTGLYHYAAGAAAVLKGGPGEAGISDVLWSRGGTAEPRHYEGAHVVLERMARATAPRDIAAAAVDFSQQLCAAAAAAMGNPSGGPGLGADDLVPLAGLVMAQHTERHGASTAARLAAHIDFAAEFLPECLAAGHAGFALAVLHSTLALLRAQGATATATTGLSHPD